MRAFEDLLGSVGSGAPLGWEQVLLHLLITFVLGQFLAWVYSLSHHGMTYSRAMVQSLVLLSLIVTVVMLSVGNNLARAFGLFGALALVRFRTPVKDARDTSFLFMAVGIGICVGASQLLLAVAGTVFVGLTALYLARTRSGSRTDRNAVLRFAMPAVSVEESGLHHILMQHCENYSLVQLRDVGPDNTMEYAYQITLFDPLEGAEMMADLRGLPGLRNLNLFVQDEDREP